jgi:hypothetical protein
LDLHLPVLIQLADVYYQVPDIETAKDIATSFFIFEAKDDFLIDEHIHRAVREMCEFAKQLQ